MHPYEIHITVNDADRNRFVDACHACGVKPIVLALQNQSGNLVMHDAMTSSVFHGEWEHLLLEVDRITNHLAQHGFNVVRKKVETYPLHPSVPRDRNNPHAMPKDAYFEAHLNVIVNALSLDAATQAKKQLQITAQQHRAHLSQNAFKQFTETSWIWMLTLRQYDGTFETFSHRVTQLKDSVTTQGFAVEKVITEFSILDTRISHDASWLRVGE